MTCVLEVDTDEIRRAAAAMLAAAAYDAQPATVHSVDALRALASNGSARMRETLDRVKRCAQEAILAADAMAALTRSTAAKLETTATTMDQAELACAGGF
jgi:hypothetical protein